MYLLIEKGIRGAISTISKRHAIANNEYMGKYDPKKESIHRREEVKQMAQKHNFKSATIFSENLVAVHMERTSVNPSYSG